MDTSELLTIGEAEQMTGKTRRALELAIQRGHLPVIHALGKRLVTRQALAEYQASAKRGRPPRKVTSESAIDSIKARASAARAE